MVKEIEPIDGIENQYGMLPVIVEIVTSDRGNFEQMSVTASGKTLIFYGRTLQNAQWGQIRQFVGVMESLSVFPERGVVAGDVLFEDRRTLSDVGYSTKAVVKGHTVYKGRECLLVDLTATLTSGEQTFPLSGYGLLDVETGAWIYSNLVGADSLSHQGKRVDLRVRMVDEISLPNLGAYFPSPSKSPAREPIEERLRQLKRLEAEGLISPADATKKRKEILEGL